MTYHPSKQISIVTRSLGLLLLVSTSHLIATPAQDSVLKHVDPFIGTGFHGHTFPGATTPFGMVQLSPDTRTSGWDACGGYYDADTEIWASATPTSVAPASATMEISS